MCSFLLTNKVIENFENINFLLQKRGPDLTTVKNFERFTMVHNLLSITGNLAKQPIFSADGDKCVLYNGEIYNFKEFGNYDSDGASILTAYEEMSVDGFSSLDGEFAIVLVDKRQESFFLITDTFGTKPMFFSIQNTDIGISSYSKPLELLGFTNIIKMKPNTVIKINYKTMSIDYEKEIYTFCLKQENDTYDEWYAAFTDSIKKRVHTTHNIMLPLSSGYDSGLICLLLNKLAISKFTTYTIRGRENQSVLERRFETVKNKRVFDKIQQHDLEKIQKEFIDNVHPFYYGPKPESITHFGFEDQGAIGLYYLLEQARDIDNCKVVLSGQGSDEIMTNIQTYGFGTNTPFPMPENLEDVFPWGNFYYGSQWSYLMKEECIAGSLGMETRYPFLDRRVVQEYLNLKSTLKNIVYKSPIKFIFDKYGYPYELEKIGFQI